MDSKNHTVTIPYEDYSLMKDFYEKHKDVIQNVCEHSKLLLTGGHNIVFDGSIDLTKKPKNVSIVKQMFKKGSAYSMDTHGIDNSVMIEIIKFEYE
jgi:hypothetical protein